MVLISLRSHHVRLHALEAHAEEGTLLSLAHVDEAIAASAVLELGNIDRAHVLVHLNVYTHLRELCNHWSSHVVITDPLWHLLLNTSHRCKFLCLRVKSELMSEAASCWLQTYTQALNIRAHCVIFLFVRRHSELNLFLGLFNHCFQIFIHKL